jgi:hypothetical protein
MVGLEHVVLDLLKKPGGRIVVGLAMVAAGLFFWFLAYPQLRDARALRAGAAHAVGDVIDSRISAGAHGIERHYDLRYRFRTGARGPWYEQSEKGPLARRQLWSTLPKDQWEQATRIGHVDVDYLPADPSVNCLAGRAGSELNGVYGLMAFAAVFALPGAILTANGVVRLIVPR